MTWRAVCNNGVSAMQGPTVPRRKALFKMLLLYLICRSKEKGIPLGGKQSPAAAEWQEEGTPGRSCYYFRGRSLNIFPGKMVRKYYRTATK